MKRIILITILFFININFFNASCYSYVVMDGESNRILSSLNKDNKMLIASTTKIMTAIVALENLDLNLKVKVGSEINGVSGSMIYVKEGEILTIEDLIYGLLLRSGNDASMVLSKALTSVENFVYLMNKKAKYLNMKDTIFENPHGLNDKTENYSTAYDLALLMNYALKNSQFRKITSSKKYKVTTNMNTHIWYNKNKLLSNYKYTTGGKIGYTKKAGHIFVSSASKNKKDLIIVSIKDDSQFSNHENLYEKYFSEYSRYQILDKYNFVIDDINYKDAYLYIKNDFYMLLKESEIDDIEIKIIINKKADNNTVGKVHVYLSDKLIHKEKIFISYKKNKINKLWQLLFFWR